VAPLWKIFDKIDPTSIESLVNFFSLMSFVRKYVWLNRDFSFCISLYSVCEKKLGVDPIEIYSEIQPLLGDLSLHATDLSRL